MQTKTRYRIVTDKFAGYEVQEKVWWWPFWCQPRTNTSSTPEDAEKWLARHLEKEAKPFRVIKELNPPNEKS